MTSFGIVCGLIPIALVFASGDGAPSSMPREERAVRTLMSQWVEAYADLDAKRIAALETPDVEIVDRFGELHLPSGRSENEKLWADTFDAISKKSTRPRVAIEHVHFIRPDVAVVSVSLLVAEGILLVDGERIPPYSELDTYIVVKVHGVWLVAAHNMHEKKP
jgi:uncharacterized protein (TIGR02246 family)